MRPRFRFAGIALAIAGCLLAPAAECSEVSTAEKVARVFSDLAHEDTPGCVVGVSRGGAPVHSSAYGMSDIAAHRALDTGSVLNVASISKQFTAFSLLLLAQRHLLSLDDPVTKYVPELLPSAAGVALRHLLHHLGGLRDYEALLELSGRKTSQGATQFETIALLARQRAANAPPGVEFDYSNTGYVVLGTVIERVSGKSLREFEQENLFRPLRMASTTVVDRYPAGLPRLARGYKPVADGFEIDESAWEQIGDGQVHTTVADLLLWEENFHTHKVGGAPLIEEMLRPGLLASGERVDYAAGLFLGEYRGLPVVRHGGSWAGYRSHLIRFPAQHLAVAVLCNRSDSRASQRAEAVAEVFLGSQMAPTTPTPAHEPSVAEREPEWNPGNGDGYVGAYWSAEAQARCDIRLTHGALVLETCGEGVSLRAGARDELVAPSSFSSLRFTREGQPPTGFLLYAPGIRGLYFGRLP